MSDQPKKTVIRIPANVKSDSVVWFRFFGNLVTTRHIIVFGFSLVIVMLFYQLLFFLPMSMPETAAVRVFISVFMIFPVMIAGSRKVNGRYIEQRIFNKAKHRVNKGVRLREKTLVARKRYEKWVK
jgi:hypothetical protein